jgi:hypothetical protein
MTLLERLKHWWRNLDTCGHPCDPHDQCVHCVFENPTMKPTRQREKE